MNILEKITKRKKSEVYNLKNMNSYSLLEKSNYFDMPTKNLAKRILEKKISIIAEPKILFQDMKKMELQEFLF